MAVSGFWERIERMAVSGFGERIERIAVSRSAFEEAKGYLLESVF